MWASPRGTEAWNGRSHQPRFPTGPWNRGADREEGFGSHTYRPQTFPELLPSARRSLENESSPGSKAGSPHTQQGHTGNPDRKTTPQANARRCKESWDTMPGPGLRDHSWGSGEWAGSGRTDGHTPSPGTEHPGRGAGPTAVSVCRAPTVREATGRRAPSPGSLLDPSGSRAQPGRQGGLGQRPFFSVSLS